MGLATDPINQTATLESDAANEVDAAVSEFDRSSSPFWLGLLLDAVQTERESINAIEQSIETLRLSLDQRRRAIDQQEEILRDLSQSLTKDLKRSRRNATRG